MEHDPEFWTTLNELFRILKNGGVMYINAPSNGAYHAYPCDVWRFYPDAGKAFAALGRKNNHQMTLLESFTAKRMADRWNDFVCVLYKGEWPETQDVKYLSDIFESYNVWRFQAEEMSRVEAMTEDQKIIEALRTEVAGLQAKVLKMSDRRIKNRITRMVRKSKLALTSGNTAWIKALNEAWAGLRRPEGRIEQKTL